MTRREVKAFIKSGVSALTPSIRFNTGRITEFNSQRSNDYPYIWLETIGNTGDFNDNQMPIDDWEPVIHIAKKDAVDSSPEQYEEIIDQCDEIAQKLKYQLNQVVSGYKLVTLTSFSREPFVKKFADCLSGVTLSFTLTSPDKTNVC